MNKFLARLLWPKSASARLLKPLAIILILSNLLPIFGVLFFDWKAFPILVLYCMETIIFILFDAFKGANNVAKTFKDFLSPIIATIGTYLMMVIILIIGQSSVIAIAAGAFTKTGNAVDSILNLYFGISVALIIIYQAASRFISRKNAKKNKKIEFKQQDTFYYSLIKQIILIAVSIAVVVSGAYTVSLIVLTLLKTFLDIRGYLRNPPEPDVVEKWFKAKV